MPYVRPVPQAVIENFGFYADDPGQGAHFGVDFLSPIGTAVVAAANGIVVYATTDSWSAGGYGHALIIRHFDRNGNLGDEYSLYAHLHSAPPVTIGQRVFAGQHIATSGNTGAGGDHLHFAILVGLARADILLTNPQTGVEYIPSSTHLHALSWNFAAQIGTFENDAGAPSHAPGSEYVQNPGSIQGDMLANATNLYGPDRTVNDRIFGLSGDDSIFARSGNDVIDGGSGNDTIEGGSGIDTIRGGDGTDTAVFSGRLADYSIYRFLDRVVVEHRNGGSDGRDFLVDVEHLQFLDRTIQSSTIPRDGTLLNQTPISSLGVYQPSQGNTEVSSSLNTTQFSIGNFFQGAFDTARGWASGILSTIAAPRTVSASTGEQAVAITTTTGVVHVPYSQTITVAGIGSISAAQLASPIELDDHGDTIGSARAITGPFIRARIERGDDADVFAVQLVGGQQYVFLLQAVNANMFGAVDPYLRLQNSAGVSLRESDDIVPGTTSSFITITPSASGTYYLEASSYGTTSGEYTLYFTTRTTSSASDVLVPTVGATNNSTPSWDWEGNNNGNTYDPDSTADDAFRGHGGSDKLYGNRGNDVLWGDDGDDQLYGEAGEDVLRGGAGDDTLRPGTGNDIIYGEAGDDYVDADSGNDTIYGGDDNDRLNGSNGDDYIKGEDGTDRIRGEDDDDELYGDAGDDDINGGFGNDLIYGGSNNDFLRGDEGHDRIAGEAGNDDILGGDGDDRLYGGNDNDILAGGAGDDLLHGESGIDTADYSETYTDLTANLFDETASSADAGTDTLYGIENLIGSQAADGIDGNHGSNTLEGRSGNDIIRGHNGTDTINGGAGDDIVWGDEGNDVVRGSSGNDEVRGGLGADQLSGDDGDDHIRGEQGNDAIDGGIGFDTVFFWGERDDFAITRDGSGTLTVTDLRSDGLEGSDTLIGIEKLEFFDGAVLVDDLFAPAPIAMIDYGHSAIGTPVIIDAIANDLPGASSASIVSVAVVNGPGNAFMVDGKIAFDPGLAVTLNAPSQSYRVELRYTLESAGLSRAQGTIFITVSGAQEAELQVGTRLADQLDGTPLNDVLDGLGGADTLRGGVGNDVYYVESAGDLVVELAGAGDDRVKASLSSYTLPNHVEHLEYTGTGSFTGRGNTLANELVGNGGSDTLYGFAENDTLLGGGGSDRLFGGTGIDMMDGGAGNDRLEVDHADDTAIGGAGLDTLQIVTAGLSYAVAADIEIVSNISGGPLTVTLNALANNFGGSSGVDIVHAGAGQDTVYGRAGNDHVLGEAANDYLYGEAGDDILDGGDGSDFLYGGSEADMMFGGSGNDTIYGQSGIDILTGGAGIDLLNGGTGSDRFVFHTGDTGATNATSDRITDFSQVDADRIDVSAIDAIAGGVDDSFTFIGAAAFGSSAGQLRYQQVGGATFVQGDTDGDGIADFIIRIDGLHTLTSGDFLI